ncbi:MAG: Na/Pi cotransporter family protein [Proteiniphilum sp.]|jgi:phosphate:Na+ symporter|nr:Na/Pi cotransporter family protein [Proteiniphilum sp.]MDD2936913.1 Na/Pi cotransporter family protein [Proteiniphilum sp.]MDD3077092.1 Na/Pi cotransporter family protein [Proteiniphilum sp.]MDD3780503.1 Na/Pi cotransporter family protein [Proteiniphilum sp.]MDD3956858.1 Na/Pi cotransporter family protein [Proteiniphilum sp.]
MDYGLIDFLKLVGSLGLFLYGMKIMSEGLQKLAGNKLRNVLSAMTKNRIMGVLTGVMITALIQSSSATTVMVVSFVNAGLLSLIQSIGVIMGANIGTTVTAWMISFFGFGKFSISALAIPLMGLALPLIFSSKSRNKSMGEFIFGFSFLFMGLDFLQNSMPDLQNNPEVLAFVQNFTGMGIISTLFFLMVGSVMTVIVQSSSATVAITLIMATKGWIDFPSAAAMIMGENIGTTITANLAAIPANISAKRAAFSHLMFNVFGVLWMLLVFKHFVHLIDNIVPSFAGVHPSGITEFITSLSPEVYTQITTLPQSELSPELAALQDKYLTYQSATSYGLSLFHTLFNICNVSLMIWFVKLYEKICLRVIRPKKGEEEDEEFVLQYISTGLSSTDELSILQAEKEMEVYAQRVKKMVGFVKKMTNLKNSDKKFLKLYNRIEKYEDISDRMEVEIGSYLSKVSEGKLSNRSKERVRSILRAVTEIESIADSACNIARHLKRKMEAETEFEEAILENINSMYELTDKALDNMQQLLKNKKITETDLVNSKHIESVINEKRNQLKRENVENLNLKLYSYQNGVFYIDIISECERMGDYIINVIESLEKN